MNAAGFAVLPLLRSEIFPGTNPFQVVKNIFEAEVKPASVAFFTQWNFMSLTSFTKVVFFVDDSVSPVTWVFFSA